MEPKGSLLCSQEAIIDPYPEPDESSSHTTTLLLYDSFQYYHPNNIWLRVQIMKLLTM